MKRWLGAAVALILALVPLFAGPRTATEVLAAGQVSVTRTFPVPGADNSLRQDNPTRNYGGSTYLYVDAESGKVWRPILKYNTTAIPAGSTVSGATLSLYYYAMRTGKGTSDPAGRTYWAYRITETDWGEGSGDDTDKVVGASDWDDRVYNTVLWSTAGGTYTGDNAVSTTVPASFGWMDWTVTDQAQYAITNGVDAHFLIMDGTEGTKAGAYFYSKEEATQTTLRPKLTITFTAPWDSYQDSGRTTLCDTFDATYNTVYMKGTTFAAGNYNVAYYDAGASGGQKTYTESNVSVAGDGQLNSSYLLTTDNAAVAGTWHALVQPAGAAAFPAAYDDAVAAPDTYDLLANDSFTVEQSAITNSSPVVDAVAVCETDHSTPVTAMTPQTEYAVKVTVTDNNTLADLSTVKAVIFYDADGSYAPGDVPGAGNTQTAAILTCTVGATPTWQIDPSANTTWSIEAANCVQPALTNNTGDFWFHFKAGKVATATAGAAKWHIYAEATDSASATGDNHQENLTMNWYGEITVNTVTVNFGTVELGSDFADNSQTGISITYICNGDYNQQIKSDGTWSGDGYSLGLNGAGTPGEGEFSLKADHDDTIDGAVLVSTDFATINTGTQTGESGNTEDANTLWLKPGPGGAPPVTYSGTIYYQISQ